jgi:hypothetical protein
MGNNKKIPADLPVVVIDSSVLRKNPLLSNGAGVWLAKLAERNRIKLHLPIIVKNEVLTQFEKSYAENTTLAFEQFSKLVRKNDLDEGFVEILFSLEKKVDSVFKSKYENLLNFYSSTIFSIESIEKDDAVNVFNNYFQGKGSFSEPKCRKDIPDAFIYEVIRKLSLSGPVILLSEDNRLGKQF